MRAGEGPGRTSRVRVFVTEGVTRPEGEPDVERLCRIGAGEAGGAARVLDTMEDDRGRDNKPGTGFEIDMFGTCISFSILHRGMDLLIALTSFLSALYTCLSPVSRHTLGAKSARRSPTSVHAPVRAKRTSELVSKKSIANRVARARYASLGFRGFLWRKCESTKPSHSPTSVP
jgi:hypothetical protein